MRLALVLAVVCATAVVPSQANAAFIQLSGQNKLLFTAEGAEANDLTVSLSGNTFTLTDTGATITPLDATCQPAGGAQTVTCTGTGITEFEANLLDMSDSAEMTAATRAIFRGGAGIDTLTGGAGNDLLVGDGSGPAAERDVLDGGAGNDEMYGDTSNSETLTGGDNELTGGAGNDVLNGGGGTDEMQGSAGADRLFGYAGADVADGGAENDLVVGGDGVDQLRGGDGSDELGESTTSTNGFPPDRGSDLLDGGPGNDLLRPGLGPTQGIADDDTLAGGGGFDSVTYEQRVAPVRASVDGAAGDGTAGESDNVRLDVERLVGGSAGDRLSGGPNPDSIDGFRGSDTITGGGGNDSLNGGVVDAESDNVSGGTGNDVVRGDAGDDALGGDDGDDRVDGGVGDDTLGGGAGADTLTGGAGGDSAAGGTGNDSVSGSTPLLVGADGSDSLRGDAGNDTLAGGDADDVLAGGAGGDSMAGGPGRDAADYSQATDNVTVTLDDRPNDGQSGEGDNVRSDVEDIRGGGVQDTFTGNAGANSLDGDAGEDYVDGRGGRDSLRGGAARDVVRARDGNRDVVDCGRSTDFAIVDRRDVLRGCERSDAGRGRARLGRAVVVRPKGTQVQFGLRRMRRTVPLLDRVSLPVGSAIDAREGSVRLTSARSRRRRQSASFTAGLFTVLQARSRRPITELRMKGGRFGRCSAAAAASGPRAARLSRRTIRRLRGRGRGRFRTRGRYSSATVRGTDYTVADRCDGTLTTVRRGIVVVFEFRTRKSITLRAGQSHLARAR